MPNIAQKIALITGGAKGIGFHCAKELLKNGLRGVSIVDNDEATGKEAATSLGDKAIFIKCDVTNHEQLEASFAETVKTFGNLDIVVNNAGIVDENNWSKMIDVNFKARIDGTLLSINRYVTKSLSGSEGFIINLSTFFGISPNPYLPVYNAINHGLLGFTQVIGTDSLKGNFRVRVICVMASATEYDLERVCEELSKVLKHKLKQTPEDIGRAVCKILRESPDQGSLWMSQLRNVYQIKLPYFKKAAVDGTYMAEVYLQKNKSKENTCIINVSSTMGLSTTNYLRNYTASKFCKNIFGYNFVPADHNCKVLTLCPGFTLTNMLNPKMSKKVLEVVAQKPSDVAVALCRLVNKNPPTGTIWVIEAKKSLYQFKDVKNISEMRMKY